MNVPVAIGLVNGSARELRTRILTTLEAFLVYRSKVLTDDNADDAAASAPISVLQIQRPQSTSTLYLLIHH